jgi:hypothetical protein
MSPQLPSQRPRSRLPRFLKYAVWSLGIALGLAACGNPPELTPGALGAAGKRPAPWEPQVAARSDAVRDLSDGEGETVVVNAVAAHEKRRP